MQNFTSSDFTRAIADEAVAARFGVAHGVHTFAEYLDHLDHQATIHLEDHLAQRVRDTAGAQRRKARLMIENGATVIVAMPMNDSHTGRTVWAETDLATWLVLMEMGANSAWFYAHKGKDRRAGQVRLNAPLRATGTSNKVAVARLIRNAKAGQQARTLDRNPLNLRASNIYLLGNINTAEGRVGRAKTDTARLLRTQAALRQSLAGAELGIPEAEGF